MIVTDLTKRIDIPHEEGQWMKLRRLSWRQLEVASDIAADAAMKRLKSMGGDLLEAVRKANTGKNESQGEQYDRRAVLKAGIVEWSYDAKVSDENIDALDEETAGWAYGQILGFNKPKSEEERKNA